MTHVVTQTVLVAVIFELNFVGSNPKECYIDIVSTRWTCSSNKLFTLFHANEDEKMLFMENSATSEIKGQGKSDCKDDF